MESVNFVHDVNVLRKTLKSVYSSSEDLKALNSEIAPGQGNCRVQVLPVCWRHLLDFPRQRVRRQEHDLGDLDEEYDCTTTPANFDFKTVTDLISSRSFPRRHHRRRRRICEISDLRSRAGRPLVPELLQRRNFQNCATRMQPHAEIVQGEEP